MSLNTPMTPQRVGPSGLLDSDTVEEWYFPFEHKWIRRNTCGEWELLEWRMNQPKMWLLIGSGDIIHDAYEAMAAWTATRRME